MPAPTRDQLDVMLSARFGRPVRVQDSEHLAPWSVMHCALEPCPTSDAPGSVIVKWLREGAARSDLRQVATEQAALEFLTGVGFAQAPRLIAADRAAGVLVLEDLSPRTPLADLLRRQGAAACRRELLAFAEATGDLAAATAGKSDAYDAIRDGYGSVDASVGRAYGLGPEWPETRRVLEDFGLTVSGPVEQELASLMEALLHPGPFLAFSNGDPEANNFMTDGADGRLIDFEFAAYRHALVSATWMHVPGPAWIVVADPICADLEDTYRRALSRGIAQAQDDGLFGFGMAAACLAMACIRMNRFAALDGRKPGDASRVQMVSALEAAAGVAGLHRSLPHLAGWTQRVAQWLRRRWPDADVDLTLYPAYAPRG